MGRHSVLDSVMLDRTDRQLIHALQLEPRAAFSRIATAIGVSEQTIARRYRQLRADGVLGVIGVVNPRGLGQSDWFVRVQCRPDSAGKLASALARREDVSWVTLTAGGSEVVAVLRSRSARERDDLLLQRLPATAQVLGISAFVVLHHFVAGVTSTDWMGLGDTLSGAQIAKLRVPTPPSAETVVLEPADEPMLDALARDGRASYATLAKATGASEGRVMRRLAALQASGIVYFDLDVATQLVGFAASAYVWLTVSPAHIDSVGRQLSEHTEVAFAAAITGSANLLAVVVCIDLDELYRYVTTKIGGAEGVQSIEVSLILRQIKQAGAMTNGMRLADPLPATTGS